MVRGIRNHMIKAQHHTFSERKDYKGKFIPIQHDHLLIFKKNAVWSVPIKLTYTKVFDLRRFENMTWRDLIQGALKWLGGEADLPAIYEVIRPSKKAQRNQHWKEKVRQTLHLHPNFVSKERGKWGLSIV